MGAGTSALERDVRSLDRDLEAHQTAYNRFPSSHGLALRDEVDVHLHGSGGVAASDARITTLETDASALELRVEDLESAGAQPSTALQNGALDSYARLVDLESLRTRVGETGTGSGPATGLFGQVAHKATQSQVDGLAAALGMDLAPGVANAGLFQRVNHNGEALGALVGRTAQLEESVGTKAPQSQVNAIQDQVSALQDRVVSLERAPATVALDSLDSTQRVQAGAYSCKSRSLGAQSSPSSEPSPGYVLTADGTLMENFTVCRTDQDWARNALTHQVWGGRPWVERPIATNSCTPYYFLAKEGDDSHICAPTLADALGAGAMVDMERLFHQLNR